MILPLPPGAAFQLAKLLTETRHIDASDQIGPFYAVFCVRPRHHDVPIRMHRKRMATGRPGKGSKMNTQEIWNCESAVADLLDCDIPAWIEQDIVVMTVASICNSGCASGSYMPAVRYYDALRTMSEHGDDVLQYIEDVLGELPAVPKGESWAGMACFFLSYAVELWAGDIMSQLEDLELEGAEA